MGDGSQRRGHRGNDPPDGFGRIRTAFAVTAAIDAGAHAGRRGRAYRRGLARTRRILPRSARRWSARRLYAWKTLVDIVQYRVWLSSVTEKRTFSDFRHSRVRRSGALRYSHPSRAMRCARPKKCRVACSRAFLSVITIFCISLSVWNSCTMPRKKACENAL